jgi:hypothetical protein
MQEYYLRIPVQYDPEAVSERIGLNPERLECDCVAELIQLAQSLIHPRSFYHAAFVDRIGEGTVEIMGITFNSRLLCQKLKGINRVFPYVLTIGPDLEQAASSQSDLLKQYYLEELANIALEQAAGWLSEQLAARFGVGPLSNMSPGSLEDWPITEQTKLFALFGGIGCTAGVRLTDSLLMVPRKSISGVFFPAEESFVACQLCDREHCQGRKAPHIRVKPQEQL